MPGAMARDRGAKTLDMTLDTIIRGGTVATASDTFRCDVGISAGRIAALGDNQVAAVGEGAHLRRKILRVEDFKHGQIELPGIAADEAVARRADRRLEAKRSQREKREDADADAIADVPSHG